MSSPTIEVNGRKFAVQLDSTMQLYVELDGERIAASTRAGLIAKIREEMVEAVNVPAHLITTTWGQRGHDKLIAEPIHVTGIHSNSSILYRNAQGVAGNCQASEVYRRLTDNEEANLRHVYKQKIDAEDAWTDLKNSLKIDIKLEVEKATYTGSDTPPPTKKKGTRQ